MIASNKKILLVEDDRFISEIYFRKLSESDFDVKLARDGVEALDIFNEFNPDVVLLDIMLPKKNGWEVLEFLKDRKENGLKIIMLTNLGEKETMEKALKKGADDYVIKASLTPAELVELIKNKIEI
jgi:DNA-binding response OmpR family regulator